MASVLAIQLAGCSILGGFIGGTVHRQETVVVVPALPARTRPMTDAEVEVRYQACASRRAAVQAQLRTPRAPEHHVLVAMPVCDRETSGIVVLARAIPAVTRSVDTDDNYSGLCFFLGLPVDALVIFALSANLGGPVPGH